jgi:hypothetical protein
MRSPRRRAPRCRGRERKHGTKGDTLSKSQRRSSNQASRPVMTTQNSQLQPARIDAPRARRGSHHATRGAPTTCTAEVLPKLIGRAR